MTTEELYSKLPPELTAAIKKLEAEHDELRAALSTMLAAAKLAIVRLHTAVASGIESKDLVVIAKGLDAAIRQAEKGNQP